MTELQGDELINGVNVLISLGYILIFLLTLNLALAFFRRGGGS